MYCEICGHELLLFNTYDNSQGAEPIYVHGEDATLEDRKHAPIWDD